MLKKFFIKNRKEQNISIFLEENPEDKGVVFVMHGLGGFKEQSMIETFRDVFWENGFTVVRFDTTNTLGESDGNYEDATLSNYYSDLEDVIKFSEGENWYREPFYLIGHSLGGFSVAYYAENNPEKVKALLPISPVVSGALSEEAYKEFDLENYTEWKERGFLEKESSSKPGVIKKLKWSHMADRLTYSLLPNASKLSMPILLIVGEKDTSTPPKHIDILFNTLPSESKTCKIIKDAEHTFKTVGHLEEIKTIITTWLREQENYNEPQRHLQ